MQTSSASSPVIDRTETESSYKLIPNTNNTIYDEYVFSTHHDLLDESGGRDLILLEMDGIIDYLLSSNQKLLDWSEHGGQFLHFTFLLEKFMQQLLDRSILFRVVYFTKETQSIQLQGTNFSYAPVSHTQNILKKLIYQHLLEKLNIPCVCFESWIRNAEPWQQFLEENRPSFIISSPQSILFNLDCTVIQGVPIVNQISFVENTIHGFCSQIRGNEAQTRAAVSAVVDKAFESLSETFPFDYQPLNPFSSSKLSLPIFKEQRNKIQTCIQALCQVLQCKEAQEEYFVLSAFAVATLLLQIELPITFRAQKVTLRNLESVSTLLEQFYLYILQSCANKNVTEIPELYDLFDGRLLYKLLSICTKENFTNVRSLEFPTEEMKQAFYQALDVLEPCQTCNDASDKLFDLIQQEKTREEEVVVQRKLKPLTSINNDLVSQMTSNWKNEATQQQNFEDVFATEAPELKNWNPTVLLEKDVDFEPKSQDEIERTNRDVLSLQKYGQSMTRIGETRKTVETTAAAESKPAQKFTAASEKIKIQNFCQKTTKEMADMRKMLEKYAPKALDSFSASQIEDALLFIRVKLIDQVENIMLPQINKTLAFYHTLSAELKEKDLKHIQDFKERSAMIANSKILKKKDLEPIEKLQKDCHNCLCDIYLAVLDIQLKRYQSSPKPETTYAVMEAVSYIQELMECVLSSIQKADEKLKTVVQALRTVKLDKYSNRIVQQYSQSLSKLLLPDAKDEYNPLDLQFHYNLNYKSPRRLFVDANKRVATVGANMYELSFIPDPWQQQLINYVELNKSVVVTAPTSSGKTFVAFYICEKILRENDTGIGIFVLPSVALCNQIYAELFSKYTKSYPGAAGKTMLGMYAGGTKIYVRNCQILVTTPENLETLLLSPSMMDWKKNVKYVVLDEIHQINADGGQVYEHILNLIQCPFLALSATIGNPVEFSSWLRINKGDVELLVHTERPTPLEYQIYKPTVDEGTASAIVEVHPCAVLPTQKVQIEALHRMPAFSAMQCLQFYRATEAVTRESNLDKNPFAEFDPETRLVDRGIVDKLIVSEYRKSLYAKLLEIAEQSSLHPFLLQVFAKLRKNTDVAFTEITKDYSVQDLEEEEFLYEHIGDLVMHMRDNEQLPAIMFHFNRFGVDKLCKALVDYLQSNNKTCFRTEKQKTEALGVYSEVLEEFAKDDSIDDIFVTALQLGVAVHYNAMPETYLKEVERLFRSRNIPLIIATGTLALGIHFPCRTVVIAGKSTYLSPSYFNQCAGRAGRRGLDTKGKVLLYGISQPFMNRLLTGEIDKLKGSMGLEVTFVLRLFHLYSQMRKGSEEEKYVLEECKRTLLQPLFSLGKISSTNVTSLQQHYFRFVIEWLLQMKFINAKEGKAMGYAGLATLTSDMEPNNFIFIHLVKQGVLHSIFKETHIPYSKKLEQLLIVLCYLYHRKRVKNNNKAHVLPPLSSSFLKHIAEYQQKVLEVYSEYVYHYATSNQELVNDTVLPLSKIAFKNQPTQFRKVFDVKEEQEQVSVNNTEEEEDADLMWNEDDVDGLLDKLDESETDKQDAEAVVEQKVEEVEESRGFLYDTLSRERIPYFAVSSFYALSGNDDYFDSIDSLTTSLRHTIPLDSSIIPSKPFENLLFNSSVVDFFQHGSIERLKEENEFKTVNAAKREIDFFVKTIKRLYYCLLSMEVPQSDILLHALNELFVRIGVKANDKTMSYFLELSFCKWHINTELRAAQKHVAQKDTPMSRIVKQLEIIPEGRVPRMELMNRVQEMMEVLVEILPQIQEKERDAELFGHLDDVLSQLRLLFSILSKPAPPRKKTELVVESDYAELEEDYGVIPGLSNLKTNETEKSWATEKDPEKEAERLNRRKMERK